MVALSYIVLVTLKINFALNNLNINLLKRFSASKFFLCHPVAIAVGALQMTNLFWLCSHAANLRLRRLVEPILLRAWPPVFHIKAEASH